MYLPQQLKHKERLKKVLQLTKASFICILAHQAWRTKAHGLFLFRTPQLALFVKSQDIRLNSINKSLYPTYFARLYNKDCILSQSKIKLSLSREYHSKIFKALQLQQTKQNIFHLLYLRYYYKFVLIISPSWDII